MPRIGSLGASPPRRGPRAPSLPKGRLPAVRTGEGGRPDGRTFAKALAFHLRCLEAQRAAPMPVSAEDHRLPAEACLLDIAEDIPVADVPWADRWCADRLRNDPEGIVTLGWPLWAGINPESGEPSLAPLLIGDARVLRDGRNAWRIRRAGGGVDLNPEALALMGLPEDAAAVLAEDAEAVAEVEGAVGGPARASAILQAIAEHGLISVAAITSLPEDPPPIAGARGLINAAALLPRRGHGAFGPLADDLRRLASGSGPMGAAAALDAGESDNAAGPPDAAPNIFPSSLQQDRAIQAAMSRQLTVAVAPAGIDKSGLVLNAAAAALCRDESVLIAAPDEARLDALLDRLREAVPDCPAVRAAPSAAQFPQLAADIRALADLSPPATSQADLDEARAEWEKARRCAASVHARLAERRVALQDISDLEARLAQRPPPECLPPELTKEAVAHAAERVKGAFRSLDDDERMNRLQWLDERANRLSPPLRKALGAGVTEASVAEALRNADAAFLELAKPPGLLRRRRRRKRMAAVREALDALSRRLPHLQEMAEDCLAEIDPKRPESQASSARIQFAQVAAEARDAVRKADGLRQLKEVRREVGRLAATARTALQAFADRAPHLRARADACAEYLKPAAPGDGAHAVLRQLDQICDAAVLDAEAAARQRRRDALLREVEALPDESAAEARLQALSELRTDAGQALLHVVLGRLRADRDEAWSAAVNLADHLAAAAQEDDSESDARALVPAALRALPLWAVEAAGVGVSLPAAPGLFDLVIIDDADRCPAAVTIPLLARGRRALVVGDESGRTSQATLSALRERDIAERAGLSLEGLRRFSCRDHTLLSLALTALDGPPVTLDLTDGAAESGPDVLNPAGMADAVHTGVISAK